MNAQPAPQGGRIHLILVSVLDNQRLSLPARSLHFARIVLTVPRLPSVGDTVAELDLVRRRGFRLIAASDQSEPPPPYALHIYLARFCN